MLQELQLEGEKYTQNNSESVNALVKRYVDFQKQDVLQFVNDLEECIQEQQNEISKAALGLGRWVLSPCYNYVKQNANDWFGSMSQVDKQHALSSLHGIVLPGGATTERNVAMVSQNNVNSTISLSMPYTSLTDSGILSSGHAEAMWKKASKLLNDLKVIKAPDDNPKTRWVSSDKGSSPHVVTTSKSNPKKYICDKQCVGWKSHNICAHCVATAEDNGDLEHFLTWFSSSKGKVGPCANNCGEKRDCNKLYCALYYKIIEGYCLHRLECSV